MNTKDYSSKLAMFKSYTIIKSWLILLFIGLLILPSLHAESINNQPRSLFSKAITQLKAQIVENIEAPGLKAPKSLGAAMLAASCGMDVFFINDQSGSVDAVENVQSRAFISAMATRVGDLGTANDASRFSISEFAHTNTWHHYNFASAGTNYTTEVSDVLLYEYAARTLSGGTSIYRAMQEAKAVVNGTAVSGRTVPKVVVLMTDAFCEQIEGGALDIALELKNEGFYIVVMAIGPAALCSDLNIIASTDGYFSATDYQDLEDNVITSVENIFTNACNAPPYVPNYDLTAEITDFDATDCVPGPGTFTADYTIRNVGAIDFNANLKIAFYDADPATPAANHLITEDLGMQTIASSGGTYMGTLTNVALESTSTVYAVVNIDGALAANATPLTYKLSSSQLNENTEIGTGNNFSNSYPRTDAGTCAPQAKLNVSVNNTGQTCNDEVVYEMTICNNGNADAIIAPTPYANASFVLSNTDILDVLPDSRFIEWQKTLGGTSAEGDFGANAVQTSDGNYIVSGNSSSGIGGNKTTAGFGGRDIWVVKLDSEGNILWDKTFGGTGDELKGRLVPTNDGGVILGANSDSGISGNKTEASYGNDDYWLLKLDANGGIDWQKAYGGSNSEILQDVQVTSDGGYILSGYSFSGISGNKTAVNYGDADYWIVKVDANGNKLWDQSYGGSDYDTEAHIQTTNDGGYLVAGHSQSPISGVKTESSSSSDYWILKLSSTGTIIWQNTLIASGSEVIRLGHTIYETSSGDFIVGGASQSGISGDKIDALNGTQDIWLVTLNGTTGALTNNNGIGGAGGSASFAAAMHEVPTGGFVLLGSNNGGTGGDKTETNQGSYDYWLLKMDESLNIEWQKNFGGSASDFSGGIEVNSAGDYILIGNSSSGISGDKTEASYGSSDFWVIKYNEGKVLSPGDCYTVQYTYDVSVASAGNYDFSVDLVANKTNVAHQDPSISPDNNFTVGTTTGLNGFNGGVQTADDVTIGTVTACSGGDLLSIAVDIPDLTVCEQSYTTATVTITNNSGGSFSSIDLDLNLSGTGTMYASEPYSLTNGLVLPAVNTTDPSYPAVTNALYNGSGMNTLAIYTLPDGTSTFKIDLEIGTGLANLSAQLNNIPTGYNTTNQSNLGTDATGITGEANPTISGTCPAAITAATASISLNYTVTGATTTQWVSGTNGTFSAPNSGTTNYTVNAMDVANGFVDLSIIASTANNCQTVENCRVDITGVVYDYGDAPASYDLNQTTLPVAAASTILTGLYLGTTAPDTEGTTLANATATGDGADEDAMDGVILTKPASGAMGYTIPVEVTNNSAATAYLTAFIDWNADGDFLDTLERSTQIIIAASSGVTTQTPSFDVPNITINDNLFLRLRLSTDNRAANVPYGASSEGEVEDVLIFCLDSDGDMVCDHVDIDDDNDGIRDVDEGYSVEVGVDTDSDGIDDAHDTDCDGAILSTDPGGNAASVHDENSIGGAGSAAAINSDNSRAALNATGDYLVMDLGLDVPIGTIIEIEARVTNNLHQMSIEESADAATFSNLQNYTWAVITTEEIKQYTLTATSRYIRIRQSVDNGSGALQVDNVAYQAFNVLVCNGVIGMSPTDTDMDGTADYLDLDSDGDGCYDKIEAGVTGFTTNGSVTDSLAATTAAEVGNNGLDDDIESDDTGAATTIASYTITQTNGGTNDFQDAAVYSPDCPCLPDSDGDGVCDAEDIDDDNDGIRDEDEGYFCPSFDGSIWVNDEDRQVIQISNINGSPSQTDIVTLNTAQTVGDIGFAPDGTLYAVTFNSKNLYRVDMTTGNLTSVGTIGFTESNPDPNSLSFDENGIAYIGGSDSDAIWNLDPSDGTTALWHDFGFGDASGDFIFLNGFVYVSWQPTGENTDVHLFRITIDANNAYISHQDMGSLPNSTFGLTSNGDNLLYGGSSNGNIYSFTPPSSPVGTISTTVVYDLSGNDSAYGLTSMVESVGNDCQELDTDNDGIADHLDLDSDGDGCYDKIEAGVTGFTTNGSVTDSLAATTTAEVGMNGLDDDIESDDTQAATTSGSYTITQTNGGTNDFQDGGVFNVNCPCNSQYPDFDNDGVCDIIDIDDDNDGIRDIDESSCGLIINGTFDTDLNNWGTIGNVGYGGGIAQFNGGGGAANGILNQSMSTIIGEAYTLNFDVIHVGISGNSSLDVRIDGTSIGTFNGGTSPSHNFIASVTSTIIEFYDASTGDLSSTDVALDNVVICGAIDTDSDGTPDRLDLDSDGDGCYDKIEAGVTGFTTNDSVTDSLAATTAGEVGMNGLDDDIESDDTQNATTSGSYTITQTNGGTNDFQDAAVQAPACPCLTVDSDKDGICDAIDIDDDNDGIRDIDEMDCNITGVWMDIGGGVWESNIETNFKVRITMSDVTDYWDAASFPLASNFSTSGCSTGYTSDFGPLPGNPSMGISIGGQPSQPSPLLSTFTVEFLDADNNSVEVNEPKIHWSQIGGLLGNFRTSSQWTLQNNVTANLISSANDLELVNNRILRAANIGSDVSSQSCNIDASGTMKINGMHSSFSFEVVNLNNNNQPDFVSNNDGLQIIFEACGPLDTDSDGIADHLDLDSDGDGCYDKIEAGVTGFTTNGSVSDSLAATTALEVGNNGLDDDIESDDTQAATTSGSYTITQTNTGTNDSQSAAVQAPDCPCTTVDFDNDGVCDAIDIDDDNDGIRDVDECFATAIPSSMTTVFNVGTSIKSGNTPINYTPVTQNYATPVVNYNNTLGVASFTTSTPGIFGGNPSGAPDITPDGAYGDVSELSLQAILGANEVITDFTISFSVAFVDDGYHLEVNDMIVASFNELHWGTQAAFQGGGLFDSNNNGIWEPWANEGNPEFMVDFVNGNVQFMVDDNIGGRQDALPFIIPGGGTYNPFPNIDLETGIKIGSSFSDKNGIGPIGIQTIDFSATVRTHCDTDSDGIFDYLDLDSDGDGCYDKIEAGVTGFTTDGSVTDSLAATTAGEVGMNGLDDDIESDDTQAATTSGSYTITQTNGGTNDFQDAGVMVACQNDVIFVEFTDSIAMDDEATGGNLPTLTVSGGILTAASTIELVLNSSPGTATVGVDYLPSFGTTVTVNIPAGDYTTPQIIVLTSIISIIDDADVESDETFSIDLTNPQGTSSQLMIGDADGMGNTENNHIYTIVDDDCAPAAGTILNIRNGGE